MADIAGVFHWTPSDMAAMALSELLMWREKAKVRYAPDEG